MTMPPIEMPLFPLNTVLFPGGTLPLRIFEPRYLTMVGERMRAGAGFAVVSLVKGSEAGAMSGFSATGTEAQIVDFDQLADGMLGITCRGAGRVRVQAHRRQSDQLIVAEVERLAAEPNLALPAEYAPLRDFLRQLLKRDEVQEYRRWLQESWDDADWISYRLAELLPLTVASKQTLLETDSLQRLNVLHAVMEENRLLN